MPIYVGSQKIKDIYYGGVKIGKIYRGNTLVYTSLAFPIDTVIYESSTAGTSTVELEEGIYEVYCIAGGGGGHKQSVAVVSGGGSGSGYIGQIKIPKGSYQIIVGAGGQRGKDSGTNGGNSSIGSLITAYGGGGGNDGRGAGGSIPTLNATEVSRTLMVAGNNGNKYNPGASVYSSYGAGGRPEANGSSGYVKIVYKGN